MNITEDGDYALKEVQAPKGYTKIPGYVKEFKITSGKLTVLEKDPLKASLVKGQKGKITSQITNIDTKNRTFTQRLIINPDHDSWKFVGPDTQLRIFTNENWSIDPTDGNSISKVKVAILDKGKSISDLKSTDFKEKNSFNYNTVDNIRRFRIKNLIDDNSGETNLTTDKAIVIDVIGKLAEGKTSSDLKAEIYFDQNPIDEVTNKLDINAKPDGPGTYIEPIIPIAIENHKAEYPLTGAMGIIGFLVVGAVMMATAYYKYRRKRRESALS